MFANDINKSFILNYAPVFSKLKRSEKRLIFKNSQVLHFAKGQIIYKQNEPSDAFYCVITGRIKLFRTQPYREEVLELLSAGMYFGVTSILTTQMHSATAQALSDSLILKIDKDNFHIILKKLPKLAIELSKTLSEQIRVKDYTKILKSNLISVYSAVRGIGRTMYAINLALSLRRETNKKVIFVEISHSGKEILDVLNIRDIKELIDLRYSIMQKDLINRFIIRDAQLGVDFLNIAHRSKAGTSTEHLSLLLTHLTSEYQYIIVDLPAQKDEVIFKALAHCDAIHLITDYDTENLKSTRDLMEDLFKNVEYPQEKIKIILNAKKDSKRVSNDEVVQTLGHGIFANIPVFWEAKDAIDEFCAKVVLSQPSSEYARAVRRIAREIGDVLVGLAFGSGGAFGLACVGVIKILERENIPVDLVVGTSIGALVAALWASGKSGEEIQEIMRQYNRNKAKVVRLLFDICFPKSSLAKGKRVSEFLNRYLGDKTFHDIKFPLKIVACNLDKREKVIFDSGRLVDAVRASLSIPGFFKPLKHQDGLIVDGGIIEPIPVNTLAQAGIKKIIAVNVLPNPQDIQEGYKNYKYSLEKEKVEAQKRNLIFRIFYSLRLLFRKIFFPNIFDIMANSLMAMEYVIGREDCRKADVVINPVLVGANWFEFFRVDELIKKGELEAKKFLPQIKALINK